jgi:nucleoside diphosphate kinase
VGEVHLFLLWSSARPCETQIVGDIASRFRVLDVVEVTWSEAEFGQNLRSFYGAALPPDSHKEQQVGTGPFLVVVVEDEHPRMRLRRMGSGRRWVNASIVDARGSYRAATGDGHRVHASENAREADRDLVLLFGRRGRDFLGGGGATPGSPRQHAHDIVGADGWRDLDELVLALHVTAGCRRLPPRAGVDVDLEVADEWWAREILRCSGTEGDVDVVVGGHPLRVGVVERPRRERLPRWLPPAFTRTNDVPA